MKKTKAKTAVSKGARDHRVRKVLPLVLAILDGWGVREGQHTDDPTTIARTPFLDELKAHYPYALLGAHGYFVGLPHGQDGNSEAGHLNLGAGRIVEQDAVYITKSIKNGTFFKNQALITAIEHVRRNKSNLHLMGLLSNYNSGHASPDHVQALLKFIEQRKVKKVFLHLFTDGRDSPRYDAVKLLPEVASRFRNGEVVASLCGRLYAMDRKKDWSRTEQAYNLLTRGAGIAETSAETALRHAYNRGESDEYLSPTVITDARHRPLGAISDHDAVIFWNLRSDRARQLAKPFAQAEFERLNPGSFKRWRVLTDLCYVALTDFGPDLGNILTAYSSRDVRDSLPMALRSLKQLYLAESEKFAHVTYFFNGGYDHPVGREDRQLVASPNVASYELTPAMSARKLERLIMVALKKKSHDVVVVNFSNLDMIGHTGNLRACIAALEVVDGCLKRIGREVRARGGTMVVTGDHGNIEETVNIATGEIDTEHSKNPVPFCLYNRAYRGKQFGRRSGVLGDVAPTLLDLVGLPKPRAMTRKSLL